MKTKAYNRRLRIFSSLLAGVFLIQNTGLAELSSHISKSIPQDIGLIKEAHELSPSSNVPTLINIKDIHDNWSAQGSIIKILDNLISNYHIRTIGIEGMQGPIDTSFLGAFPDEAIRENTASYMMRQGKLSAGEFVSLMSNGKISVYGMEDNSLYEANLAAYKKLLANREGIFKPISAIESLLQKIRTQIYSEELQHLNENGIFQDNGRLKFSAKWQIVSSLAAKYGISTSSYENLAKLIHCIEQEKEIRFESLEEEREAFMTELSQRLSKEDLQALVLESLAYKTGEVSKGSFISFLLQMASKYSLATNRYPDVALYADYTLVYESIDMEAIRAEVGDLEDQIREKLFRNNSEKEFFHFEKRFGILKDIFDAKLRSESLREFQASEKDYSLDSWKAFLVAKCEAYGLDTSSMVELAPLFDALPEALSFYKLAEARNEALLRNTLKQMQQNGDSVACLVTGGYHSKGITELLKEKQSSYVVVLPRFNKNSKRPYATIIENSSVSYKEFAQSQLVRDSKVQAIAHLLAQSAYRVIEKTPRTRPEILNARIQSEIQKIKDLYLERYQSLHPAAVPREIPVTSSGSASTNEAAGSKNYIAQRLFLEGAPDLRGVEVYLHRVDTESSGEVTAEFRVDFTEFGVLVPVTVRMREGRLEATAASLEEFIRGDAYRQEKGSSDGQAYSLEVDQSIAEKELETSGLDPALITQYKEAGLSAETFGRRKGLTDAQIQILKNLINPSAPLSKQSGIKLADDLARDLNNTSYQEIKESDDIGSKRQLQAALYTEAEAARAQGNDSLAEELNEIAEEISCSSCRWTAPRYAQDSAAQTAAADSAARAAQQAQATGQVAPEDAAAAWARDNDLLPEQNRDIPAAILNPNAEAEAAIFDSRAQSSTDKYLRRFFSKLADIVSQNVQFVNKTSIASWWKSPAYTRHKAAIKAAVSDALSYAEQAESMDLTPLEAALAWAKNNNRLPNQNTSIPVDVLNRNVLAEILALPDLSDSYKQDFVRALSSILKGNIRFNQSSSVSEKAFLEKAKAEFLESIENYESDLSEERNNLSKKWFKGKTTQSRIEKLNKEIERIQNLKQTVSSAAGISLFLSLIRQNISSVLGFLESLSSLNVFGYDTLLSFEEKMNDLAHGFPLAKSNPTHEANRNQAEAIANGISSASIDQMQALYQQLNQQLKENTARNKADEVQKDGIALQKLQKAMAQARAQEAAAQAAAANQKAGNELEARTRGGRFGKLAEGLRISGEIARRMLAVSAQKVRSELNKAREAYRRANIRANTYEEISRLMMQGLRVIGNNQNAEARDRFNKELDSYLKEITAGADNRTRMMLQRMVWAAIESGSLKGLSPSEKEIFLTFMLTRATLFNFQGRYVTAKEMLTFNAAAREAYFGFDVKDPKIEIEFKVKEDGAGATAYYENGTTRIVFNSANIHTFAAALWSFAHELGHAVMNEIHGEKNKTGGKTADQLYADEGVAEDFSDFILFELAKMTQGSGKVDHGFDLFALQKRAELAVKTDSGRSKKSSPEYFFAPLFLRNFRDALIEKFGREKGMRLFQDFLGNGLKGVWNKTVTLEQLTNDYLSGRAYGMDFEQKLDQKLNEAKEAPISPVAPTSTVGPTTSTTAPASPAHQARRDEADRLANGESSATVGEIQALYEEISSQKKENLRQGRVEEAQKDDQALQKLQKPMAQARANQQQALNQTIQTMTATLLLPENQYLLQAVQNSNQRNSEVLNKLRDYLQQEFSKTGEKVIDAELINKLANEAYDKIKDRLKLMFFGGGDDEEQKRLAAEAAAGSSTGAVSPSATQAQKEAAGGTATIAPTRLPAGQAGGAPGTTTPGPSEPYPANASPKTPLTSNPGENVPGTGFSTPRSTPTPNPKPSGTPARILNELTPAEFVTVSDLIDEFNRHAKVGNRIETDRILKQILNILERSDGSLKSSGFRDFDNRIGSEKQRLASQKANNEELAAARQFIQDPERRNLLRQAVALFSFDPQSTDQQVALSPRYFQNRRNGDSVFVDVAVAGRTVRLSYQAAREALLEADKKSLKSQITSGNVDDYYDVLDAATSNENSLRDGAIAINGDYYMQEALSAALFERDAKRAEKLIKNYTQSEASAEELSKILEDNKAGTLEINGERVLRAAVVYAFTKSQAAGTAIKNKLESAKKISDSLDKVQNPTTRLMLEIKRAKLIYEAAQLRYKLSWISKADFRAEKERFENTLQEIDQRINPAQTENYFQKIASTLLSRVSTLKSIQSAITENMDEAGLKAAIETAWEAYIKEETAKTASSLKESQDSVAAQSISDEAKQELSQRLLEEAEIELNRRISEERKIEFAADFRKNQTYSLLTMAAKGQISGAKIREIIFKHVSRNRPDFSEDQLTPDFVRQFISSLRNNLTEFNELGLSYGLSTDSLKGYLLGASEADLKLFIQEIQALQIEINLLAQEIEFKAAHGKVSESQRERLRLLKARLANGIGDTISLDSLKQTSQDAALANEAQREFFKQNFKNQHPRLLQWMNRLNQYRAGRLILAQGQRLGKVQTINRILARIAPILTLTFQIYTGMPVDAAQLQQQFHESKTEDVRKHFEDHQTTFFKQLKSFTEKEEEIQDSLKELDEILAPSQGLLMMEALSSILDSNGEIKRGDAQLLEWALESGLVSIEQGNVILEKLRNGEAVDLNPYSEQINDVKGLVQRLKDVRVNGVSLYENWRSKEAAWMQLQAKVQKDFKDAMENITPGSNAVREKIQQLVQSRFAAFFDAATGKLEESQLQEYMAYVREAVRYGFGFTNKNTGELGGLKADQLIMLDLFMMNRSVGLLAGGGKSVVYPLYHIIGRAALGNQYHGMIVAESADGVDNLMKYESIATIFGMKMDNGSARHEKNEIDGLIDSLQDADTIVVIGKTERAHIQNLSEKNEKLRSAINENRVTLIDEVHLLATDRDAALLSEGSREIERDKVENVQSIINTVWDTQKGEFKADILKPDKFETEEAFKSRVKEYKDTTAGENQRIVFQYEDQVFVTEALRKYIQDETGASSRMIASTLRALTNLNKKGAPGGWDVVEIKEGDETKEVIAPIDESGIVKESSIISDVYYQAALALAHKGWDVDAAQKLVRQSDTSTQVATIDALHSDYGARLLGASGTTQDLEFTIQAILGSPVVNINPSKNQFHTFTHLNSMEAVKQQIMDSIQGRVDGKRRGALVFVYDHEMFLELQKYFAEQGYGEFLNLIGAGKENVEIKVQNAGKLIITPAILDAGLVYTDSFLIENAQKIETLKKKQETEPFIEKFQELSEKDTLTTSEKSELEALRDDAEFLLVVQFLEAKRVANDTSFSEKEKADFMNTLKKISYFGFAPITLSNERGRVGRDYKDRDGIGFDLFELGIGSEKSTELMFNQSTRRNRRTVTDGNRYVLLDEKQKNSIREHLKDITNPENRVLRGEVLAKLQPLFNEILENPNRSEEETWFMNAYIKLKGDVALEQYGLEEQILLFQKYMTIKRVNDGTRFIVQDTTRTRWAVDPIKRLLRDIQSGNNLSDEQKSLLRDENFKKQAIGILEDNLRSVLRRESDEAQLLLASAERESGRDYVMGVSLSALQEAQTTFESLKGRSHVMDRLVGASQRLEAIGQARRSILEDKWQKMDSMKSYAEAKRLAGADYMKLMEYTYQVSLQLADENMVSRIGRSGYQVFTEKLGENTTGRMDVKVASEADGPSFSPVSVPIGVQMNTNHLTVSVAANTEVTSVLGVGRSGKAILIGNKLYIITQSGESRGEEKVLSVLTDPQVILAVQRIMEGSASGNAAFFDLEIQNGTESTKNKGGINLSLTHLPQKITPRTTFTDLLFLTGMDEYELYETIRHAGNMDNPSILNVGSIQDMALQLNVSEDQLIAAVLQGAKAFHARKIIGIYKLDADKNAEEFLKNNQDPNGPDAKDTARLLEEIKRVGDYEREAHTFKKLSEAALKLVDAKLEPSQAAVFPQHFLSIYQALLKDLADDYEAEHLDEIDDELEIYTRFGLDAERIKNLRTSTIESKLVSLSPEDLKAALKNQLDKKDWFTYLKQVMSQNGNAEQKFLAEALTDLANGLSAAELQTKIYKFYGDDDEKRENGRRQLVALALPYKFKIPAVVDLTLQWASTTPDLAKRENYLWEAIRLARNTQNAALIQKVDAVFVQFLGQKADKAYRDGQILNLQEIQKLLEGLSASAQISALLASLKAQIADLDAKLSSVDKEFYEKVRAAAGVLAVSDEQRFEAAMYVAQRLKEGVEQNWADQRDGLAVLLMNVQVYFNQKQIYRDGFERVGRLARTIGTNGFIEREGLSRIYFYSDTDTDKTEALFTRLLNEWAEAERHLENNNFSTLLLLETTKQFPTLQKKTKDNNGYAINPAETLARLFQSRYLPTEREREHEAGLVAQDLISYMEVHSEGLPDGQKLLVRAGLDPEGKIFIHTDRIVRMKSHNLDEETIAEDKNQKNLGSVDAEYVVRLDANMEDHDPNSSVNTGKGKITHIVDKQGRWFENEFRGVMDGQKQRLLEAINRDMEKIREKWDTETEVIIITKSGGILFKNLNKIKKDYPDAYEMLQQISYKARVSNYRDANPDHRKELLSNLKEVLKEEAAEIDMKRTDFEESILTVQTEGAPAGFSVKHLMSYKPGQNLTPQQFSEFLALWVDGLNEHELQHEIDRKVGRRAYWSRIFKGDRGIQANEILTHLRSIARGRIPQSVLTQITTYISRKNSGIGYQNAGIEALQMLYKHLKPEDKNKLSKDTKNLLKTKKNWRGKKIDNPDLLDPTKISAAGRELAKIQAQNLRLAAEAAMKEYMLANVPTQFQELNDFVDAVFSNKSPENLTENSLLKDDAIREKIRQTEEEIKTVYEEEFNKARANGYQNAVDFAQSQKLHLKTFEYAIKVVLQGYDFDKLRRQIQGELHTLSVALTKSSKNGDHFMGLEEAQDQLPSGYEAIEQAVNARNGAVREHLKPYLEQLNLPVEEVDKTDLNDSTRGFISPGALKEVPFYVEGEKVERGSTAAYSFDSFGYVLIATEDSPEKAEAYKNEHILGHETQHFRIDIVNEGIREGIVEMLSLLNARGDLSQEPDQHFKDVLRHLAVTEDRDYVNFAKFAMQYLKNFSYEQILLAQATGDLTFIGIHSLESGLLQMQRDLEKDGQALTDDTIIDISVAFLDKDTSGNDKKPRKWSDLREYLKNYADVYQKIAFRVDAKNKKLIPLLREDESDLAKYYDYAKYQKKRFEQRKEESKKVEKNILPAWTRDLKVSANGVEVEIQPAQHSTPAQHRRIGELQFDFIDDVDTHIQLAQAFGFSQQDQDAANRGQKSFYLMRHEDPAIGILGVAFMDESYSIKDFRYIFAKGVQGWDAVKIKQALQGPQNLVLSESGQARRVIGSINAEAHESMVALMQQRHFQGNDLSSQELHEFYVTEIKRLVAEYNQAHGTDYETGFPAMGYLVGDDGINPYAGNISSWNSNNAIHGNYVGPLGAGVYHLDFDASIRRPGQKWVTSDRATLAVVGPISEDDKKLIWLAEEALNIQVKAFEKTGSMEQADQVINAWIKQRGLRDVTLDRFGNHRIDAAAELYESLHTKDPDRIKRSEILDGSDDSKAITFEKFVWQQDRVMHQGRNILFYSGDSTQQDPSLISILSQADQKRLTASFQKGEIKLEEGNLVDAQNGEKVLDANGRPLHYFKGVTLEDRAKSGQARVSSVEDTFLRVKDMDGNFHAVRTGSIQYEIGNVQEVQGARLSLANIDLLVHSYDLSSLGDPSDLILTLYHGSTTQQAANRDQAMPETAGQGLYLTSFVSARQYAQNRSLRGGEPKINRYQLHQLKILKAEGNDGNLLPVDLLIEWRNYLDTVVQPPLAEQYTNLYQRKDLNAEEVRKKDILLNRLLQIRQAKAETIIKNLQWGLSPEFSKFLRTKGFDGIAVLEGGEEAVDPHITVVVFDRNNPNLKSLGEFPVDYVITGARLTDKASVVLPLLETLSQEEAGQLQKALQNANADEINSLNLNDLQQLLTNVTQSTERWKAIDWDAALNGETNDAVQAVAADLTRAIQNPANPDLELLAASWKQVQSGSIKTADLAKAMRGLKYESVWNKLLASLSTANAIEPQAIIQDAESLKKLMQKPENWAVYKQKITDLRSRMGLAFEIVGDVPENLQAELSSIGQIHADIHEALRYLQSQKIEASNITIATSILDENSARAVEESYEAVQAEFRTLDVPTSHFVLTGESILNEPLGLLLGLLNREYRFSAIGIQHNLVSSLETNLAKRLGITLRIYTIRAGDLDRLIQSFIAGARLTAQSA